MDPTLYRQLVGSLMYLVNTRPDLCFAVNTLSQFMVEPRSVHWVAAKHVLRYLSGTWILVCTIGGQGGSNGLVIQTQIGQAVW